MAIHAMRVRVMDTAAKVARYLSFGSVGSNPLLVMW